MPRASSSPASAAFSAPTCRSFSLDLHANVTQLMVDNASFMSAYRTYPHIEWLQTRRAGRAMARSRPVLGAAPGPRLPAAALPHPHRLGLLDDRADEGALRAARDHRGRDGRASSLCAGFPSADIYDMGATVIGYYGADQPAGRCGRRPALPTPSCAPRAAFLEHLAKPQDRGGGPRIPARRMAASPSSSPTRRTIPAPAVPPSPRLPARNDQPRRPVDD